MKCAQQTNQFPLLTLSIIMTSLKSRNITELLYSVVHELQYDILGHFATNMCQFFNFSATQSMVSFDSVRKGTNHIEIFWTIPKYFPYWYQHTTSCRLLCDQENYYLTERERDSSRTSSLAYDLRPASVCMIKLVAVYNPASNDPGILLLVRTQQASK